MRLILSDTYELNFAPGNFAQLDMLKVQIEKWAVDAESVVVLNTQGNPVTCPWIKEPLFKVGHIINFLNRSVSDKGVYTLFYNTTNSKSLTKILLPVPKTLLAQNPTPVFQYLNALIDKSLFSQQKWSAYPTQPEQITELDAIKAVLNSSQTRDDLEFKAINLKNISTLLIYCNGLCFYISYGSNPEMGFFGPVIFNLQKGFIMQPIGGRRKLIMDELQTHFHSWQSNNYADSLFAQEMALPQLGPKPMPELIKKNMEAFSPAMRRYINAVNDAALDFPGDESMAPDDITCQIMGSVSQFPVTLHGEKYDLETVLRFAVNGQGMRSNPTTRELFSLLEVNADWHTFDKVKTWCAQPKTQVAQASALPSIAANPNSFLNATASSAGNGELPVKRTLEQ